MLCLNPIRLLAILVLTLASQSLSATVTYLVGTCKSGLTSFPTISAALAATPAPNTVEVCPGTYTEQVVITQAVKLEGIASGSGDQAIIVPPSSGLTVNATDDMGNSVAAQVLVQGTGPVTRDFEIKDFSISNITIDAMGNGISDSAVYVTAIFVQHASGSVNHVSTRNQKGNGLGVGVWAEGDTSTPSVTVKNSSIHDFDLIGIWDEVSSTGGGLTATNSGNYVDADAIVAIGTSGPLAGAIIIDGGIVATDTGNVMCRKSGADPNIPVIYVGSGASGSTSGNTLFIGGGAIGIDMESKSHAVTSNKIFGDGTTTGISLGDTATVRSDTIVQNQVAIEFNCVADASVSSNTIIDAVTGLDQIPTSVASADTYYDVGTETINCTGARARSGTLR